MFAMQRLNPVFWIKNWLEGIEVVDPKRAHFIDDHIPAACPFARDIVVFGHKVGAIPPLCKLNPLYDQLVMLKFKAQCYLADHPDPSYS